MATYIILLDHESAKLFKLLDHGVEAKMVRNQHHLHHTPGDQQQHKDDPHFFGAIAKEVKDATELLLIGPGLAKTHLKTHLERHNPVLAKAIVGVEACDSHHVSEKQIFAFARKFFKTRALFV